LFISIQAPVQEQSITNLKLVTKGTLPHKLLAKIWQKIMPTYSDAPFSVSNYLILEHRLRRLKY
jgi:uncharacterized membrane protein